MAYRYWCGECGFKTAWVAGPEGAGLLTAHYAKQHPDVPPGGSVEDERKVPRGWSACLVTVGVLLLLLVAAAACRR